MSKSKSMTKTQKRQTTGTLLFLLATIQIINFARLNIGVFPQFYIDPAGRGLMGMLVANLNWPFKAFNWVLYYLLGWVALITPLFFYALGASFFSKRETQAVKRRRIIILWGIGEFAFLVYVASFISFIILPGKVQPGAVARIFAEYLRKVGGLSFLFLFFIWSLTAYLIYVRKSSWKALSKEIKKGLKFSLAGITALLARIFQGKTPVQEKKQKKYLSGPGTKKAREIKAPEKRPEKEKINDEEGEEPPEKTEPRKEKKPLIEKIKKEEAVEAEYDAFTIKEFDTTGLEWSFSFEALKENEDKEIDKIKLNALVESLEENFEAALGISLRRTGITIGPRLVRVEYEQPKGIQLKEIEKQKEELSARMGGIGLDVELPIPGTKKFGVYLGREEPDVLGLGSYLGPIGDRQEKVPLLMGVAPDGEGVWCDGAAFPHLLVGGTTGSGKSVFMNTVILNLMALSEYKPINICLIDPKQVEFAPYRKIPQLAHAIITDVSDARTLLEEAEKLMDNRYTRVTEEGVRNIEEYNDQSREKMPYLFILIDEFADLVMQDKGGQIKRSIIRLAQKSRAVGIHVILATQRPSADVIDGLIKANFPARVAFKASSRVDSRIILDENGAEDLLGKGDMIIKTAEENGRRLQGIYVSIGEIKKQCP